MLTSRSLGGVQCRVLRSRVATSEENAAVTLYIVSRVTTGLWEEILRCER